MARLFKKDIQNKPVNFNRDNSEVNLRSSPAVAKGNVVATVKKWFVSLGKLGTATGTIETVDGKPYFWIRLQPSIEVKAWFAVTFNFKAPPYVWVRSDVVHWQGAKTIVRRATEKAVEPVKEVLEVTTDAAGDILSGLFSKLAPWAIAGGTIWYLSKQKPQRRTA